MEIFKTFHPDRLRCEFSPVVPAQFRSITRSTAAVVYVRLTVVIYKHTRINERHHSFYISDDSEFLVRIPAHGNADSPGTVPVLSVLRMWKIEVI